MLTSTLPLNPLHHAVKQVAIPKPRKLGREDRETLEGISEGAEKHPDPDLNPDSVPDPEPPHGEGVGVGSERKQGAKQRMVRLKAMFNKGVTRADRMFRRAARQLGKPATALKQFKGELLTRGRDIVEGLIRKASKPSPNQPRRRASHLTTPSTLTYNSRRRGPKRV